MKRTPKRIRKPDVPTTWTPRTAEHDMIAAARKRREQNFAVKIEPTKDEDYYPDSINLCVTYNGAAWHSVELLPAEIDKVIAALQVERDRQKEAYHAADREAAFSEMEIYLRRRKDDQ